MAAQPVTITEAEMKTVLGAGKRPPAYQVTELGQLVAVWTVLRAGVDTGMAVKVYTSVFHGVSRGVGEDSIRVCVVDERDPDKRRGVGKTTYTTRTTGWEKRLVAKVKAMFELALAIPSCPACGARMALRENGKDKTLFMGCTAYPGCRRTMPVPKALEEAVR